MNQYIIERYDSLTLFQFNPNKTSKENFKKLGLTKKQINTVYNYLNKGGKFYVKEDFRKIYGIRHQQYLLLKPYILLPDKKKGKWENRKAGIELDEKNTEATLFTFDPNTATNIDFNQLGLSNKQIKTIRNYLAKIGRFKTKEDFKKVYGISTNQYNRLEPFILIETQQKNPASAEYKVELNSATIDQLIKIRGIGEYTAKAIINYRNRLGGYVNVNQLLEIKATNRDYFNSYKNDLMLDMKVIKKISLNFSEIKELARHPYLNYQQAKAIVTYRTENGSFTSLRQLDEKKVISNSSYQKIAPYLNLN